MNPINDLTVIATVGGEGTRMYPLTLNFPKPLLPICNYPIIKRIVEIFASQGARKFIFASKGYLNTIAIKDVMRYGRDIASRKEIEKLNFNYPPRYDDLGSADAARNAMEYFDVKDYVLVVGGDQIMDVDINEMLKFHKEKGALMTIGLKKVENISEYGIAILDDNKKILKFVEKPKEKINSNLANIGVYIISPEIREIFKKAKERVKDFGKDFIPYLVENYDVYGYIHEGYWNDVGNVDEYLNTTMDILQGKVKNITLKSSSNKMFNPIIEVNKGIYIRESTLSRIENKLNREISLKGNVLIGGDCEIFDNVIIENSCIGDGCRIRSNTIIKNSVILDFAEIGEKCYINKSIVGRFATINEGSKIDAENIQNMRIESSTITPVIGDNVEIFKNSIIYPSERVAPIQDSHKILSTGKFVAWGMDSKNFYFALK
ncbi:MAG: sugar phosphate nucleotidyltransferase [Candidatus Altarchaeaceae archaeon]